MFRIFVFMKKLTTLTTLFAVILASCGSTKDSSKPRSKTNEQRQIIYESHNDLYHRGPYSDTTIYDNGDTEIDIPFGAIRVDTARRKN